MKYMYITYIGNIGNFESISLVEKEGGRSVRNHVVVVVVFTMIAMVKFARANVENVVANDGAAEHDESKMLIQGVL